MFRIFPDRPRAAVRAAACLPVLAAAALAALASPAAAGGGWIADPGDVDLQFGFSRKTAESAWNPEGTVREDLTRHDFRYGYVSGEVGVVNRLSANFLVTYLHGIEGDEINKGLSDAWFGAKFRLTGGAWPMALGFTMRTDYLYDLEGPYDRHLYMEGDEVDVDGEETPLAEYRGVSPEWRGILKEDYTFSYAVSRTIMDRGWTTLETGYTFRAGAPADQWPLGLDAGLPIPWANSSVKVSSLFVKSLGNDDPREPDDRFGSSANNNFNDASMWRLGGGLMVPIARTGMSVEAGYNHWVWGRSARRYAEPFFALNLSN